MGELNNMSPVANVKTKGYKGKSDKQVIDAVMANFKKRGYGVDRKGFGFISLEEEFINRSLNYLNTEAEYAAFDVLPQVLKNGKEIRDDEHKGRGHNTVTFAAPVVINGKAGIMGAVVMRKKGNRYKTHRIVMPDGSQYIFEQEKTEVTTSGMTGEKIHGEGPDIASAINDSISQTDKKDNGKSYSFKGIDDENVKYSIREDDPPKKTVKGYKVFVVKSGKLYPPMVANPGGADTPVGVWLDADEGVRAGESKTGRPQVKAGGKGTQGGSGKLAYRPGWHLGEAPMATQFARLNKETGEKELFPENFVWAECEAAADHDYQDEAMSYGYSDNGKFRHAYAGLPRIPKDGMYRYRTNPDPSTVPWIISGSMKVTKVLSDAEVDEILRSNATVSETAPEDKSKLWVDSSDGDTLKYWYGSKKEWRKAPVVRKGGKKTLEELGITNDTGSNATQFSLKDSDGRELSEQQQEYFKDSKIRDEDGNLLVLYHQTENDFTIFDTRREGAGTRDNGTPYGIFLKPTSKDIGLRGKKQMALYADIKNPLKAKNRADLDRILKSDKEYAAVREELDALDTTYKERFEKAKKAFIDFITAWRKENPDAKRSDIYDDPEFNKIYEAEDAVVEEWTAKADDLSVKCKETINAYLNEQGYDGVILEEDAGSFGRSTKAYIALDQQQVKNIDNSNPTSDPDIRFSLKNEKLSPDARIPYTAHQSYISVKKNDNAALKNLQDSVRKLKRGTYENKATGYKADINRVTIGKILNPSGGNGFNRWSKKYIDNLNAATQLPELFENAVYVDTKENQKSKKANQQIQGYHHFVAPIYMDGKEYRARIVAREKQNSDVLYIVETEIMPIKNGSSGSRSKASYFVSVPFDISIPELVNGVKIYDYNMQKNDIYNHNDIKYSMPDEASVIDYMNEQETEFADLTGFRDYEVKAKQVRQQTYGELVAQVEKLKNDKRFTKGKVLDERSVREEINDMIVTLMSYSESYNSLGVRKKTDHNLVREGVNAAKQIFTAMKKGDVSDVVTKAELAAQQIVENLKLVEDTAYVEYKDLRDYLRTTRMVISEEDAADIPDFKQFKKSNFGRIRIVSQNGIPVDTAYQELMERYPELFSDEITHPADMLRAIADVRESLEPYDIMLSAEETEQLVKQTAQDLIDIAATGKAWKSWADKKKEQYDEKLKMLKQRQREALRDVKKKEREHAEEKLREERQKGKERLDKKKEQYDEKLQREKDKAKEKAERQRDSKERKRLIAGIEQNRKWLSDRLSKPTDDKHIPEGFRTALADLLSKIDMQSQKSKALEERTGQRARRWVEMDELKARFAEIAREDGSGSFECLALAKDPTSDREEDQ